MLNKCTILSICEAKRDVYKFAKDYEIYATRLVKSIRKNGGTYRDIPVVLWYGEDAAPSEESKKRLSDLGCRLVSGKCEYVNYPVFNKISACNIDIDSEYVMWMDSDIYVLGDISELLETDKDVVVSPDQNSMHRWSRPSDDYNWRQIYDALGTTKPIEKIKCHIDGRDGNFYFCSGIFMFKTSIGFPERYKECASKIFRMGGPFTENFTQTGLGMAVHTGRYTYDLIPEKYHYFYTLHNKKLADDTTIVHYQDNRITEIADEEWNVI